MKMKNYLSVSEFAEELEKMGTKVSEPMIRHYIRKGSVLAKKHPVTPRFYLIPRMELEKFVS